MRIPRIYQPGEIALGQLKLSKEQSHHVATVLRLRPGNALVLFNGDGNDYAGKVLGLERRIVSVEVEGVAPVQNESPIVTHLAQALCRGEKMDWVIQKSVELGVNEITPIVTEFSQVHIEGERLSKKEKHWEAVIHSACEQSGRAKIPKLNPVLSFEAFVARVDSGLKWILHPQTLGAEFSGDEPPSKVTFVVGPEGGFSASEISRAMLQGYFAAALGSRILRAETAPLAALVYCQTKWGDFSEKKWGAS